MESQVMALSCNDEFIASIIINSSENPQNNESLLSDHDFAQELQMQEVIVSSLINLKPPKQTFEIGESSKTEAAEDGGESSLSLCEICAEKKDKDSMFPLQNCTHTYCTDCISRHVSIKIKKSTVIACPGIQCSGTLEIGACRDILPSAVVSAWEEALCEEAISAAEKVYCPYKNCSGVLLKDGSEGMVIGEAECPYCHRLLCARCGVPWHSGIDCEGYSRLGEDERETEDIMVHDLAKKHMWKRCSRCNFFIERNEGCLHITCRCGYEFCYACGEVWTSNHGGCQ